MAVMLCELPHDHYRVFSGVSPLPPARSGLFKAHTALVHADAATPDVAELIAEMAERTESGYVFGGLASSRHARRCSLRSAATATSRGRARLAGCFSGGLSGVAFARDASGGMGLMSRVTQGCRPVSAAHEITRLRQPMWSPSWTASPRWTCCWPTWAYRLTSRARRWPRCAPRWWA